MSPVADLNASVLGYLLPLQLEAFERRNAASYSDTEKKRDVSMIVGRSMQWSPRLPLIHSTDVAIRARTRVVAGRE